MPFQKGNKIGFKGRPRRLTGTRADIRNALEQKNINLIFDFIENLQEYTDPYAKNTHILKLMEFIYPKPREVEISEEQAAEVLQNVIKLRSNKENPRELPAGDNNGAA